MSPTCLLLVLYWSTNNRSQTYHYCYNYYLSHTCIYLLQILILSMSSTHVTLVINSDNSSPSYIQQIKLSALKILIHFHLSSLTSFTWSFKITPFSTHSDTRRTLSKNYLDFDLKSLNLLDSILQDSISHKLKHKQSEFTAKNLWLLISEILLPLSNYILSPKRKPSSTTTLSITDTTSVLNSSSSNTTPSVAHHIFFISHLPESQKDLSSFFGIQDIDLNTNNLQPLYKDLKLHLSISTILKDCVLKNAVISFIECGSRINPRLKLMISNMCKVLGGRFIGHDMLFTQHPLFCGVSIIHLKRAHDRWIGYSLEKSVSIPITRLSNSMPNKLITLIVRGSLLSSIKLFH